jgi:hypothetical protein
MVDRFMKFSLHSNAGLGGASDAGSVIELRTT